MPYYPYRCQEGHDFEVVKKISEIDREETCAACGQVAERGIALVNVDKIAAGDWNRTEWNPGLGRVTKGWKDAEKKAKAMGLEPIGTEKVESIHKKFDQQRDDTYRERWADDRIKA